MEWRLSRMLSIGPPVSASIGGGVVIWVSCFRLPMLLVAATCRSCGEGPSGSSGGTGGPPAGIFRELVCKATRPALPGTCGSCGEGPSGSSGGTGGPPPGIFRELVYKTTRPALPGGALGSRARSDALYTSLERPRFATVRNAPWLLGKSFWISLCTL
jgi:hypothetical protein